MEFLIGPAKGVDKKWVAKNTKTNPQDSEVSQVPLTFIEKCAVGAGIAAVIAPGIVALFTLEDPYQVLSLPLEMGMAAFALLLASTPRYWNIQRGGRLSLDS